MTQGPAIVKLAPSECLALLEQAKVGRIALSVRALPVIQPVRFVLSAGLIIFRAAPGSQLSRAAPDAVVAFQADHSDEDSATGWHVMAQGRCQEVTSPTVTDELRNLPLAAWAAVPHQDTFMQILPTDITGERVSW
jgi:nitroimidazol reductase NimA-like FMN-containing flavoprotein (pyridoxamine 5'-phosphate oxidase superfamily)